MKSLFNLHSRAGKITLYTTVFSSLVMLLVGSVTFFQVDVPQAIADDVTTSVTVLNTAPNWTVDAEEASESSATTPTNSGSVVSWVGTGTDDNAESYYLLICKTGAAPTANSSAAPSCGGGISNRWAVSALTASGAQASVSTTTIETFPFDAESNDWHAWICDGNASLPKCNATAKQGSASTASPFVVNHPPIFGAISNDGPVNPDGTITWTSTSYDNDVLGSADTVRLFVCKTADFTGTYCGAGGAWATSTLAASNAATSTVITAPVQDKSFDAFVYLVDSHGRVATSTIHGSNSTFTVNNVAPTVTASQINLLDTDNAGNLTLITPSATTGPFKVTFEVVDDNSCLNSVAGNEISAAAISVYRSGVTQTSCDTSGEYNSNSCYVSASGYFNGLSCSQDGGTCSGSSDDAVTWTCTFPLWFNADPTDAATQYTAENWLASVQATDDDSSSSALTETTAGGNELTSFMSFDVTSSAVAYGSLQPGQTVVDLATTTDLRATGNVGLDQDAYGDTMCTTWTSADSCDANGISPLNDIVVGNQKIATSTVLYGSAFAYNLTSSTSPINLGIHVLKTVSTSSIQTKNTHWGISIPGTITLAGDYTGQNTLTAIKSSSAFW